MISLGCAKNLVDAEIMLGSVLARGMQITFVAAALLIVVALAIATVGRTFAVRDLLPKS